MKYINSIFEYEQDLMTKKQKEEFEEKLKTDPDLKKEHDEYLKILNQRELFEVPKTKDKDIEDYLNKALKNSRKSKKFKKL